MERVSIDLPPEELAWAQAQVEAGEAESIDAYFRNLAARHRAWLEAELAKGEASGISPLSHEQVFAALRKEHDL
uniref:ribbon-helix-helix domain-containing protein n=1 Tax=uncultured Sphingomonas sp. TaxID=158754 RepID=UPI0025D1BA65|nr:hypothetical protein [uncultured Sphingomonas sp.]